MGLFTGRTVYAGKWAVKDVEFISAEDQALVNRAEVVPSEFGLSVCFFMKAGGQTYIPVSNDCNAKVGESVDLSKAEILTLKKAGESDIQRIRIND